MSEAKPPNILITSDPTFEADVYGRSSVVVVDFWASWCAPCRMLMPTLEKIAGENQDWLTLVKVNTDECPMAAGKFGIQGIPAVFAILNDSVVDQFQGALPEKSILEWLAPLKSQWELSLLENDFLANPVAVIDRLQTMIESNPKDATLKIRLAEKLLILNRFDEAAVLLEQLESRGFLEPEATKLKSQLNLMGRKSTDSVEALMDLVQKNPKDFTAKLKLAEALAGSQQFERACEVCLELVAQDRRVTGEKARELMIDIFRTLPDESEITSKYRRQLALALY